MTLDELCELQEELDGRGMIAGGAVRNIVTGHPIKDIDIFIPQDCSGEELALKMGLPTDGVACEFQAYDGTPMKVFKGASWHGYEIDFIACIDPYSRIKMFPDSISRMRLALTSPWEIVMTREARETMFTKRIECTRISHKRLARLKKLYPEPQWTYVINSMFEGCNNVEIIVSGGKPRRAEDHAPFWWDMPRLDSDAAIKALGTRAMKETHLLCGSTKRSIWD